MNSNISKPVQYPTKSCQYGENCYRKNPVHFTEFSHSHLENILTSQKSNETEYKIPDDLLFTQEIILDQLKILEQLYPNLKNQSVIAIKPTSASESSNTNIKRKHKDIIDLIDEDTDEDKMEGNDKMKLNKKGRKQSPVAPENVQPTTSSQPIEQKRSEIQHKNIYDYISVVLPKGQMAKKLEKAAPYNFFLTTITASPMTHNEALSVTFQELLDSSLGDLESSMQINFMIDIGWLLGHYFFAGHDTKPLIVLYGDETPELRKISTMRPNVTSVKVHINTPFGVHHTKMMFLAYKDNSMRVIVSTANLYEDDWQNRTQGLWISPKCPGLPDSCDTGVGESPTGFRGDLLRYLMAYNIPKIQSWITRVRKSDFSAVNVFFVASVPGGHRNTPNGPNWGHPRLGYLLSKHSAPIDDSCPIVCQSSSIGSLGPNVNAWVLNEFANSVRKDSAPIGLRKLPMFKMIYPSFGNVKSSHDGMLGGGCLPYNKVTHDKQQWLKNHLQQWKSRYRFRSQAMPHIKSYCRWSDRGLYWFLLTSANLSKSAWGVFNKTAKIEPPLRIMSYEAGVLFLPKFVLDDKDGIYFPLNNSKNNIPPFPMPYDIPLTPYGLDDSPYFCDYLLSS